MHNVGLSLASYPYLSFQPVTHGCINRAASLRMVTQIESIKSNDKILYEVSLGKTAGDALSKLPMWNVEFL